MENDNWKEQRTANSTLAIGGVSSPLDSFVVAESSVLRTNFCGEKPAHRQSAFQGKSQTFLLFFRLRVFAEAQRVFLSLW
jgi:hypothetical protein